MARLARQAIFIPLSNIESFPKPERTKEDYDAVRLKGKGGVLRGFCCKHLEAGDYSYCPDRLGLGFSQSLAIEYHGDAEDFIDLLRTINNIQADFIVFVAGTTLLYPIRYRCKHRPFLILGDCTAMTTLSLGTLESNKMSFVLEADRVRVPYPYYDGTVEVIDCTTRELMEHLNGKEE